MTLTYEGFSQPSPDTAILFWPFHW